MSGCKVQARNHPVLAFIGGQLRLLPGRLTISGRTACPPARSDSNPPLVLQDAPLTEARHQATMGKAWMRDGAPGGPDAMWSDGLGPVSSEERQGLLRGEQGYSVHRGLSQFERIDRSPRRYRGIHDGHAACSPGWGWGWGWVWVWEGSSITEIAGGWGWGSTLDALTSEDSSEPLHSIPPQLGNIPPSSTWLARFCLNLCATSQHGTPSLFPTRAVGTGGYRLPVNCKHRQL